MGNLGGNSATLDYPVCILVWIRMQVSQISSVTFGSSDQEASQQVPCNSTCSLFFLCCFCAGLGAIGFDQSHLLINNIIYVVSPNSSWISISQSYWSQSEKHPFHPFGLQPFRKASSSCLVYLTRKLKACRPSNTFVCQLLNLPTILPVFLH